jgi:hypothetical protein
MIARCRHGPRSARIEDIEQTILDDLNAEELDEPGFRQCPTV